MKPARILLGIVVLVALGLAVLLFFLPRAVPKPLTYRGKNIEYWFSQLPVTPVPPPGIDLGNVQGFVKSMGQQYGGTSAMGGGAIEAFNAFGTNAEPFLIARLKAQDSNLEKGVTTVATNVGVGYLPFRTADLERMQAVSALISLRTLTPDTTQTITSLTNNANREVASAAAYILKRRASQSAK